MIRCTEYVPNPHYNGGVDPGGLIRDRRKVMNRLKAKRARLSAGAILAFQPLHVKHVYSADLYMSPKAPGYVYIVGLDAAHQGPKPQERVKLEPGMLFQFVRRSEDSPDILLCKPLDETSLLARMGLPKGQAPTTTSEGLLNMGALDMVLWES